MIATEATKTPPATPGTGDKRKLKRRFAYLGANSLAISILLHVLFGIGATFLIVEHFQKKHIDFHATEPPSQHTEIEHKVELAKRNNVESAPPDLKRIVTTDVSSITLPEPPEVPTTDEANPSTMSGVDGVMGNSLGSGLGKGGNGAGGGIPLFGAVNGSGLKGYFYDLKQTPDRNSSGVTYSQYYEVLKNFLNQGWNDSVLQPYYRSRDPVGTGSLAISIRRSEEAPKAFGVENEVQASLWAVHYRAKVKAPKSGDYRFAGFADNVMVVKIKNTVVLDAGCVLLTTDPNLSQPQPYAFPTYTQWEKKDSTDYNAHLKLGASFHLEANESVDMDVLMGDDGGICCFFLMVEKEGEAYANGAGGYVSWPFFQVGEGDSPTFSSEEEHPPYSASEPWQLVQP